MLKTFGVEHKCRSSQIQTEKDCGFKHALVLKNIDTTVEL